MARGLSSNDTEVKVLVLTRQENDKLVLREGGRTVATITVVRLGGGKVRLGIDAEASVEVWRGEVLRREVLTDGQMDAATG